MLGPGGLYWTAWSSCGPEQAGLALARRGRHRAAEAFLEGGEGAEQTMITAKSDVDHLPTTVNARLNYSPSDKPIMVEDGGIFQKFEKGLDSY